MLYLNTPYSAEGLINSQKLIFLVDLFFMAMGIFLYEG